MRVGDLEADRVEEYPAAEALDRHLKDRPTNAGDVAKVGAGAAAGAIVGRVIGGNTKGAVIGGVIGGAVGTQRAVETQDRDVVVLTDQLDQPRRDRQGRPGSDVACERSKSGSRGASSRSPRHPDG